MAEVLVALAPTFTPALAVSPTTCTESIWNGPKVFCNSGAAPDTTKTWHADGGCYDYATDLSHYSAALSGSKAADNQTIRVTVVDGHHDACQGPPDPRSSDMHVNGCFGDSAQGPWHSIACGPQPPPIHAAFSAVRHDYCGGGFPSCRSANSSFNMYTAIDAGARMERVGPVDLLPDAVNQVDVLRFDRQQEYLMWVDATAGRTAPKVRRLSTRRLSTPASSAAGSSH
jgi:hypothetical protein